MHLTNEQWGLLEPFFTPKPQLLDKRGRKRRDPREVLDGILWILKTGAQWNQLPKTYPPYQTCHRWFQYWSENGLITKALTVIAQDMEERGKLSVRECFIDGTFASAKKGGFWWVPPSGARVRKSWQLQTQTLFRSPALWPVLLRMKSRWWKERLPTDLPERYRRYLWATGHTTPIPLMKRSRNNR